MNDIELWHGDCLELMKDIKDNSIDLIIADLPYGYKRNNWDFIIDPEKLFKQYRRIIKNNSAICLFAKNPLGAELIYKNKDIYKYDWIWDKHIPRGFATARYQPMNKHEQILVFGFGRLQYYPIKEKRDKPVRYKNYSKKQDSVYEINNEYNDESNISISEFKNPSSIIVGRWEANKGKFHPTQKPISLISYLIKTYSKENDLVLDNCVGSGTTLLSCLETKRRGIGIEKEKKYFDVAVRRINE